MNKKLITNKINNIIEDIAILYEKKERSYITSKLNNQQYVLLTLVIRNPVTTTSELAEKMEVTKSAISQQISKLEADGYITRKQDENDKRSFTIELGKKGLKYKSEMELFNDKITQLYDKNLSADEMNTMLKLLEKFHNLLEQM